MIRSFALLALALLISPLTAAEPKVLFDGKSLDGWQNNAGSAPGKGWVIEDGALVRKEPAGDIWTKERFGDFILDLEFKTKGNSGVFIRTDDPKNNVQTGIEIQVDNPSEKPGKHSVGAVYDLLEPKSSKSKKDDWNHLVITAKDNKLTVTMNGEQIVDMDLNQWKDAGMNPDGTKNKYKKAVKDWKREGHIGLQEHGAGVSYRNIKIKPLDK